MRIQNNVSNILRIFKKFCDFYNKMIKTYNKEINKITKNYQIIYKLQNY